MSDTQEINTQEILNETHDQNVDTQFANEEAPVQTDAPQNNQDIGAQEQGSVEGGYDSVSEFEGGYDPVFNWADFEDDVVAEEPVDTPAAGPLGGTPPLETVGWADAAGDPEIQMPPDYVGRAGVAVDGQEPNDAPDPSGGTPPPEYVEQAGTEDAGDAEIEMSSDGAGRAGDPLEKYVQRLEVRYGKELAQDGGLLLYEVELDGLNSALDYYIRSGQGTWEDHVRLATKIHELEQKRDSYLEKIKDYYDRDAFREEQDDHHREDFDELPVIGSDKDPASESIEDAGETVGDSYGYGDYFGW